MFGSFMEAFNCDEIFAVSSMFCRYISTLSNNYDRLPKCRLIKTSLVVMWNSITHEQRFITLVLTGLNNHFVCITIESHHSHAKNIRLNHGSPPPRF